MRRPIVGLMILATFAVACGGGPPAGEPASTGLDPDTTTSSPQSSNEILPRCYESSLPSADPSYYSDTPKYVGNEMPAEAVRQWASQYPDFVDIWIDREHNGWVAAGFTDHVAERQSEIEEMFPDDGVVAVELDWTDAELAEVESRVVAELSGVVEVLGTSVDALRGYVNVAIPVLSEESLHAIVERFPAERICVEGLEPEDVVPPGPQPQSGDGWRLLVDEDGVGGWYTTGIAWDEQSLTALMAEIPGIESRKPEVDFENEIVIWFGAVHGSSCPNLRLDDVVVAGDLVHAVIVNTDNALACTDDAIPHTYLVAVERDRLPVAPFYVSIDRESAGDRLLVKAALREQGSSAGPGEVGPSPAGWEPEGSGVLIETGFPWEYTIDLTCGFEALGEINDYEWTAAEPIPESWLTAAGRSDSVVVEVLLHEGPEPFVEVTYAGETIVYEPADGPVCPAG